MMHDTPICATITPMNDQRHDDLTAKILEKTGQCVKCGLCVPHCPTYQLTLNENESGRGRIALIRALAKEDIPLTQTTQNHLDHCLTCRACEAVCPSEVKYGEIIDMGRQWLATQRKQSTLPSRWAWWLRRHWRIRLAQRLLWPWQKLGVLWLVKKVGIARLWGGQRQLETLGSLSLPIKYGDYPAKGTNQSASRGKIGLLLGCINQWTDKPVYQASIQLLTALGYDIVIPKQQTCCGALWQHAGDAAGFAQSQAENHAAFRGVDALVTVASGCAASLIDYQQPLPKVWEISAFLAEELAKNPLQFKPLSCTIAYHVPCTQRNGLRQADASKRCLQHIPDVKCVPLSEKAGCCGAAGLNMLQHPETADPLALQMLAQVNNIKPKIITTTNIGCMLHLQRHLQQQKVDVKIVHPVLLLANQLDIK